MQRKLYLMRHGRTRFNDLYVFQAASDSPLTETGVEMSLKAGRRFADLGLSFDHYYTSSSERASDTLELVMEGMGTGVLPYERTKGLKEFDVGLFEGSSMHLCPKDPEVRDEFFVPFGGESHTAALDRVTDTLTEIMERPDHHNVLAITHGGVSVLFLKRFSDPGAVPPEYWLTIPNCSAVEYSYEPVCEGGDGRFRYERIILPEEPDPVMQRF